MQFAGDEKCCTDIVRPAGFYAAVIPAQDGVIGSGEFQRREDMGTERRVRLRDCNRTMRQMVNQEKQEDCDVI
jgi:hypothetical protein